MKVFFSTNVIYESITLVYLKEFDCEKFTNLNTGKDCLCGVFIGVNRGVFDNIYMYK